MASTLKPAISSASTFPSSQSSSLLTPSLPLPLPLRRAKTHSFGLIPSISHGLQHPLPSFSRRLFPPSVSGTSDAFIVDKESARKAGAAIRRGIHLFKQGDVSGSLSKFDKAIELDFRQKAFLWQRGLSLYYLDRFEEGAEQLRFNVAEYPYTTMESIWCFLCEAKLYGVDKARNRFPKVGSDKELVMREAYNMFKEGGDPEKLVENFPDGENGEYFYASLCAGLYYESLNKHHEAEVHIRAACMSPYGQRSDDYMTSLAKVHCLCRNWIFN